MTASTVTYPTTGDKLGYWDFFPSGDPGWGRGWLQVRHSRGATAAAATWREVHAGRVPPDVGHVVSLWD